MTTAKPKKLMSRRQKEPLQRRNARRDVLTERTPLQRPRAATDGAIAPAESSVENTRRLSSPAVLTRRRSTGDLDSAASEARRARADAIASRTHSAPLQVSKPVDLRQSSVSHDRTQTPGKAISPSGKPLQDFATRRTLFPVESNGKIQYLPIASEATPEERRQGLFVATEAVKRDAVNTLLDHTTAKPASLQDFATRRTLFATQRTDGKREYLPKESEATALELSQGKYVPDEQVEAPPTGNQVLNQRPLFDFTQRRDLFATQAANGTIEYLPKKTEATALELGKGHYINDREVSLKAPLGAANAMTNNHPRYDIGKGREVYGVKTKEGKTLYLPRESKADGLEKSRGLYIPDEIVDRHESLRRRTALNDDSAEQSRRRAKRAAKLPAGVTRHDQLPEPVLEAKDGTRLWDGFTPPTVSEEKQGQTLAKLRPKYDLGKGRMVYPTETALGKIEYLPLREDASSYERNLGLYATFVPPEPLQDFLANAEDQGEIARQSFATERGEVQAYSEEDINRVFEQAPNLVLRSASLVRDSTWQIPELQQQFSNSPASQP